MDRKLTFRERARARSRRLLWITLVGICVLALPIVLSHQAEIIHGLGKVRTALVGIYNVTAYFIEAIRT